MNADNLLYLVCYRTLIQNFKKNAKARYFRPGHVNISYLSVKLPGREKRKGKQSGLHFSLSEDYKENRRDHMDSAV